MDEIEMMARLPLFTDDLFKDVNEAWRAGKPTGTASLMCNRRILRRIGVDLPALAAITDEREMTRQVAKDQALCEYLAGKTASLTAGATKQLDVTDQANQEKLVAWTAAKLGDRPNVFRMSADFQRQLLATDHSKAVVSDLRLPFPAMMFELEPVIELRNRQTGMHPLQTLAVMEITQGDNRYLSYVAYCGAKKTSMSAFDDNYQCSTIALSFDDNRIWTAEQALEELLGDRADTNWNNPQLGGTVDGEEHSVSEMLRQVIDRLVINATLYLSQPNPSIRKVSNNKRVTVRELREAPEHTKVKSRRGKPSKMKPFAYVLGADEGTVRVAYKTLVRGHWRQQPYGKGRLLRKTLWIKPHTRNNDAPGEAAAHEYRS